MSGKLSRKLIGLFLTLFLFIGGYTVFAYSNNDYMNIKIEAVFSDTDRNVPLEVKNPKHGKDLIVDFKDIESYQFAFWIVDDILRLDLALNDNNFNITSNLSICAIYTAVNDNVVIFIDQNNKVIETKFITKDIKKIDEPTNLPNKNGYINDSFESIIGSKDLENISENSVFKLTYIKDININYKINVIGGVSSNNNPSYNEIVNLKPSIENFSHWEEDGEIVSFNDTYFFSALSDRSIKAISKKEELKALLYISDDLKLRSNYRSHLVQLYTPSEMEVLEFGYLVSKANTNLFYGEKDVILIKSNTKHEIGKATLF